MKKIVILGGGISGLSLLWNLKKKLGNSANITLLEKTNRVGGWIRTVKKEGFLFEKGPRSCRTKGAGKATLQLIEELELQDQVIQADPAAHHRYLYLQQSLQKIPSTFFAFLFSPLTRKILPHLLMEWRVSKGKDQEETIHQFFSRRICQEFADTFFDALTLGIYACNSHFLSMKSCFPTLYHWEQQYGSLLKGALLSNFSQKNESSSPFVQKMGKASIISFKEGMEYLPQILAQRLEENILLNHEVTRLLFHPDSIEIGLENGKVIEADEVYCTLPAEVVAHLIQSDLPEISQLMLHPSSSVAVVNLGYKSKVLPFKGFGYLIPSKEQEDILGMVWDSAVFPQQNSSSEQTRLTVMIGEEKLPFSQQNETDFLNCALDAMARHLNIEQEPHLVDISIAKSAIPQYPVGYEQKKERVMENIQKLTPQFKLLGSSFNGVAINDCIARAREIVFKK